MLKHRKGILQDGIGSELVRSSNGGRRKTLSDWLASIADEVAQTFTSGDASPSVLNGAQFITAGSTAITDFDDAVEGQVIFIYRGDADIVITRDATKIETLTAANVTLTATHPMISLRSVSGVWQEVERSDAAIKATGSTTARTLAARFGESVNVKDYGATGDGATDDTTAITAAVTAAGVGGSVYFPEGVYIFSTVLTQLSGQRWHGAGRSASILRLKASVTSIAVCITASDFAENYSIEDLQIDGNRDNITPATDLYNTFFLVRGPRGGKGGTYRNLILSNSWGRVLQTSNESVSEFAEDILVENVRVLNAGTKAISATRSKCVDVIGCFAEVDPYTSSDHPGGVGDGNAASGSCFEQNEAFDVNWIGCHGHQIGASIAAPGFRIINYGSGCRIVGGSITGASYMFFLNDVDDIDASLCIGRNIRGNAILIGDSDNDAISADAYTRRIRVHNNTVIDPTGAYVLISVTKDGADGYVECYIYDNHFVQESGSPTHGIYNSGVISPATGGECRVYEWGNRFTGTIPNKRAGPAAAEIEGHPDQQLRLLAQSAVASATHTGSTAETTLATVTVPGTILGKNGFLLVKPHFSFSGSGGTRTTRIRLGGSQVTAVANASTILQQSQITEIRNRNSLSAQLVSLQGATAGIGASASAPTTLTKDTSGDLNLTFTVELANAGDSAKLESCEVWFFHAR